MRLSEDRIQFIAAQIARELTDKTLIKFSGSAIVLESEIARVIHEDLGIEDEIDKEVVDMIESMQRKIPHGSAEWQAIFMQKKEEIARLRNYIY
jgi:hypothetical protein